jgi:hypothetical protein
MDDERLTGVQLVELQRRYHALTTAIDACASGGEVQAAPQEEAALNAAYDDFQSLAAELMPALMNAAADGIKSREVRR